MRVVALLIIGLASLASMAQAATPEATPAVVRGCDELWPYWGEMLDAHPGREVDGELDALRVQKTPYANLAMLRTETLLSASDYFNAYLDRLDEVEEIPYVVSGLHAAYIGHVVLLSRLAEAHAEGRVLDAALIGDLLERNFERIRAELEEASTACGDQWVVAPIAYYYLPSDWWKADR